MADVIAKANENHTDAVIYPEFFGSKDAGVDYLKKLENGAFGEYKQEYSKVVMTAEGKIVGYNLITITGDFAAISAIGIHPDFQRKGLGQALLVNSLIDIIESNPDVKAIGLAVTLSNPAKLMYEKHGFTVRDEFSSIVLS
ncbi:MAG: GNAT family N-acetyltransferase [Candidatus Thorarchaeota archaeon]|nr:GNAT family N-acetyltransferase [Candidatus Thorarchaeota archaeon]